MANQRDHGRVAIVTGGGRGIGRATALALAAQGVRVAIAFRQNRQAAEATVADIERAGGEATAWRADVTSEPDVTSLAEAALERFGAIHILVNNAGSAARRTTVLDITRQEWEEVVAANLTSAFLCTRAVLPTMIAQRYGRIVNVASLAGITGGVVSPHYTAAKGGLIAFTRHLGRTLARHGITVNAVAPNFTETDLIAGIGLSEEVKQSAANLPMGRIARPEEVAAAIAFLCSEAASYISGECIAVSGGL